MRIKSKLCAAFRHSALRRCLLAAAVLAGVFGADALHDARAAYWRSSMPPLGSGNTITCADGFSCARAQQEAYYGTGIVKRDCYFIYNTSGALTGAKCDGWNNPIAKFARHGLSDLICEAGEYRTATGCVTRPPADKDDPRPQLAGGRACSAGAPNPINIMAGNPVDTRNGRKIATVTWDQTVSGNKGLGRVTTIQHASGSVEWAYNPLGQITQEKKTTSSQVYNVNYAYDLDGNVVEITYPSGRIVSFSRDAVGRIVGVTSKKDSGSAAVTLASNGDYHPFGPLKSFTFGNSLVFTRTLTQDYLIDNLKAQDTGTSTTVVDRGHAFGDDVNLTGITDNVTPARSEAYAYTDANRLESASGIWGALAWGYDSVGNRTSETLGGTAWTYTYPSTSNKLSTVTEGANVRSFTHDGAGNVSADDRVGTTYNYRYNNRGRLDRVTIGATVTADYVYDGLERLAIRTTQNMTPAGTTHYIYDLQGRLIAEADAGGQTLREYIWLDDMPLAVVADVDTTSPQLFFVHADHLDRPIRMTDGSQAVVWDAVYRPFGAVVSITGSASNNLRFPGQYFLLESGLHYNWHRHYDPTTGRYLQADPLGFIDGPGLYAYARSSPAMYVDETGQFAIASLIRPLAMELT